MYTKSENRMPGKFEGNQSQHVARVLYDVSMLGCNDAAGDVTINGIWIGLIIGKMFSFIVSEDTQGFFDIQDVFSNNDIAARDQTWEYMVNIVEGF